MMKGPKKRRKTYPVGMTVLSGVCAAIWLFRILIRGENDPLTVAAGIAWTACGIIWGLRTIRAERTENKT